MFVELQRIRSEARLEKQTAPSEFEHDLSETPQLISAYLELIDHITYQSLSVL